ncbi:MAG: hypothetical protein ACI9FG_000310 [Crocinitomicaceae bacterium]
MAKYRSIGDVALQAGNSESIVKESYLNVRSKEDGNTFFRFIPDDAGSKAVLMVEDTKDTDSELSGQLRVV